jgi:lipopolysaccharide biosynthesis glycosyltransferase
MLVSLLISHVTEWKTCTRRSPLHARYPDICELQEAHDDIGWDAMMVKNISILWREIQEQYYRGLAHRYSSLHWTGMLIQKLWQVAWDQLDHRNEILDQHENLVTLAEATVIAACVQE